MNKGQIFSIDLLLASIIAILLIGVLINTVEIKNYEQKESILSEELRLSSEAALLNLLNGKYSCKFAYTNLTNSIDFYKLNNAEIIDIEKTLGLLDSNFEIWIKERNSNAPIKSKGIINGKNVSVYEINYLDCDFNEKTEIEKFYFLNDSARGTSVSQINKNTLILKVSK